MYSCLTVFGQHIWSHLNVHKMWKLNFHFNLKRKSNMAQLMTRVYFFKSPCHCKPRPFLIMHHLIVFFKETSCLYRWRITEVWTGRGGLVRGKVSTYIQNVRTHGQSSRLICRRACLALFSGETELWRNQAVEIKMYTVLCKCYF